MLASVLDELLRKVGPGLVRRRACDVLLAIPEPRPGFPETEIARLCSTVEAHLTAHGVAARVSVTGRGHAGALAAVEQAIRGLAERAQPEDPVFLILGLDSHHHPDTLLWLETERRLAREGVPGGFSPGEGAGGLVLTTAAVRASWKLPRLAVVRGAGVAHEPLSRMSETGSFGVGMHQAVARATSGLSLPDEAVDAVYCDINGERYRSEEWGLFAMRGFRALGSLNYTAPCDCWGDVGAAFGPLALVLAAQAFVRGHAPGPRALIMAGSDGGLRGAVVLQASDSTRTRR
ncbi:MAG: hypothetical protein JNK56_35205 [Myxococcales bacterium]|nr:hypothetical protein [Myxococcales bacterium]